MSAEKKNARRAGGTNKDVSGAKRHKEPGTEKASTFVDKINAELLKQDKSNVKVGRIVDEYVAACGGTQYGEDSIGTLAGSPDLMCSAEHLRKCWRYYQLIQKYGELTGQFPKLLYGHLYQISRLLVIDAQEEIEKAIVAMANHAMDSGKDGNPMPVDRLAQAVTTHIKSLKKPALYPPAEGQGATDEEEDDPLEDSHVALNSSIQTIQDAAQTIEKKGEYRHAAEMQMNLGRIAQCHIAILKHIVTHDPASSIIQSARLQVVKLGALIGLKLAEEEAK